MEYTVQKLGQIAGISTRTLRYYDEIEILKPARINMTDIEKFKGFKQKLVDDNERKYGAEIRKKYGDKVVDKSNNKVKGMSKDQMEEAQRLEALIIQTLNEAFKTGNPAGKLAQNAADLHRKWISIYWDKYTKDEHAGLAQMYVDDERFTAYYDKEQSGTAIFLRDAILVYTGVKKQNNIYNENHLTFVG